MATPRITINQRALPTVGGAWRAVRLAGTAVTALLLLYGLQPAWSGGETLATLISLAVVSLLLFAGAFLPAAVRRYPLSLTALVLSIASWTAPLSDGMAFQGTIYLEDLPIPHVLPFVVLLESAFHAGHRRSARMALPILTAIACLWLLFVLFDGGVLAEDRASRELFLAGGLLLAAPQLVAAGRLFTRDVAVATHRLAIGVTLLLPLTMTLVATGGSLRSTPSSATPTPLATAHEIREFLRTYYPHWDTAPRDLDSLWRDYSPRILAAAEACGGDDSSCRRLHRSLGDLFAELDNGHTAIVIPDEVGIPPVDTRKLTDGVAVTWVDPDHSFGDCQVDVGSRIVSVDGLSVETAMAAVPGWLVAHAPGGSRNGSPYGVLLWGPPGSVVEVAFENGGEQTCTVAIVRESAAGLVDAESDEKDEDDVWYDDSSETTGYLKLEGFGGESSTQRMHETLDELMDRSRLIIDLRGNPGGIAAYAEEFAGRFFGERALLGVNCHLYCDGSSCELDCDERWLEPTEPKYAGNVAVLIDEYVVSAAEAFAYALCRQGNACCFGRTTAGETDFVVTREYGGVTVRVASGRFEPSVGPLIQGRGLEPHVVVPLRIEDLRTERDPVRQAAESWLAATRSDDR